MKVRIGRSYRYPDASVTDVPLKAASITVEAPLVLFEVLSPSAETTDRRVLFRPPWAASPVCPASTQPRP